jgi:hypothetical protein
MCTVAGSTSYTVAAIVSGQCTVHGKRKKQVTCTILYCLVSPRSTVVKNKTEPDVYVPKYVVIIFTRFVKWNVHCFKKHDSSSSLASDIPLHIHYMHYHCRCSFYCYVYYQFSPLVYNPVHSAVFAVCSHAHRHWSVFFSQTSLNRIYHRDCSWPFQLPLYSQRLVSIILREALTLGTT